MRYETEPGWHDELEPDKDRWFGDLVLDIGVDAEATAPVDSGHLKQSVYAETHGDTGIVGAKAHYTLYVEEGHEVVYVNANGDKVHTGKMVPPQPFLRPALYRKR